MYIVIQARKSLEIPGWKRLKAYPTVFFQVDFG